MRTFVRSWQYGLVVAGVSALSFSATSASAQTAPSDTPPTQPAQRPASEGGGAQVDQNVIDPRGLTADVVGDRARKTSYSTKAAEASLMAAAARVDQAWTAFLPRLTAKASYTRLSEFTPPSLLSGPGALLLGTAPATDANGKPLPTIGGLSQYNTSTAPVLGLPTSAFTFPLVFDQYNLTGSIVVPISDYFGRINQSYTAATSSEEAARWDIATQGAKAESDGKVAFYTWLRAKGAVNVAVQALADQKTHLEDSKNQFQVGNASKADVLRAETGVASAEFALEQAKNLETLTVAQIRIAIHAQETEQISTSEDILARNTAPVAITLAQALAESQVDRPEIRSLDANADALRQQAKVQRAGNYPNVSAFADVIEANPNPRIFPAASVWFPTWDAGIQAVWSPNDVFAARPAARDYDARVASIEAQKQATRDGIIYEVTSAWQGVREADYHIETSARQVTSATEAYRVARELFNAGRGTATTLTDAETELVRARLEVLNANVDARIARVRLDHALGKDARPPQPQSH